MTPAHRKESIFGFEHKSQLAWIPYGSQVLIHGNLFSLAPKNQPIFERGTYHSNPLALDALLLKPVNVRYNLHNFLDMPVEFFEYSYGQDVYYGIRDVLAGRVKNTPEQMQEYLDIEPAGLWQKFTTRLNRRLHG
jgi:hypothetical protein